MERVEIINEAFKRLRFSGIAKSQREFAKLLDVNEATISKALKGEDGYLSDIMMSRINALMIDKFGDVPTWDDDCLECDHCIKISEKQVDFRQK